MNAKRTSRHCQSRFNSLLTSLRTSIKINFDREKMLIINSDSINVKAFVFVVVVTAGYKFAFLRNSIALLTISCAAPCPQWASSFRVG